MTTKKAIDEGLAETYFYQCCHCPQGGLSRDEVTEIKRESGAIYYICDQCKSRIINFGVEDID